MRATGDARVPDSVPDVRAEFLVALIAMSSPTILMFAMVALILMVGWRFDMSCDPNSIRPRPPVRQLRPQALDSISTNRAGGVMSLGEVTHGLRSLSPAVCA